MLTIEAVIDEISLEGSEGITLECLFQRLLPHNNNQVTLYCPSASAPRTISINASAPRTIFELVFRLWIKILKLVSFDF